MSGDYELMTFQEQIEEYPALREMFTKRPILGGVSVSPPWRVWARRTDGSPWGRKDFETYPEAFAFWKAKRKLWLDVSITCKRQGFDPPGRVVKIVRRGEPVMIKLPGGKLRQQTKLVPIKPPPGHLWCGWCRRFTVFKYFTRHHAFSKSTLIVDSSIRRCCICGISEQTALTIDGVG